MENLRLGYIWSLNLPSVDNFGHEYSGGEYALFRSFHIFELKFDLEID